MRLKDCIDAKRAILKHSHMSMESPTGFLKKWPRIMTSQLSACGILIFVLEMNFNKEVVKATGK